MWRAISFIAWLLAISLSAHAENAPIDCSKQSLAEVLGNVKAKDILVTFTGVCAGPIVIATDGLTLKGVGTAIIDGGGDDAVEVRGASRVALTDIEVRNGQTGIVARNGAHISMVGVNSHHNTVAGIAVLTVSSAEVTGISALHNGTAGLLADDGASIKVSDSVIVENTRDLQLTFGARADLRTLVFDTYTCDNSVLVRGTSGITCPH